MCTMVNGGAGIGIGPCGNVLGRWICDGIGDVRGFSEGEFDEAEEARLVGMGGESSGGESVSRVGKVMLTVPVLGMMGRMFSESPLGRRPGSVSVLDRCCRFGCLGSRVSKCELSRWIAVSEERRRGTWTFRDDFSGTGFVADGA